MNPASPTTTNAIGFVAPTDGKIYGNSCLAAFACGNPSITVDSTNRTITVSFSAPVTNVFCPEIIAPVSGVEGQFGPLSAGTWVFEILGYSYPFNVIEAPLTLSIQELTNSSTFQLYSPVSGDTFVLEFNNALSSGNWQSVTNTPTISSNRNTVQIPGGVGNGFFRLRRLYP